MEEGTNCVDRISELPDFILHHILSCLSTREAAQTGILSKRLQYIWQTFPILDCNEWLFGRDLDIHNPKELGMPKVDRRKIFNQRVKFMSYVDEKLLRFVEENLRVNKFLLHITLVFALESLTILNLRGCLLSSPLDIYAITRCSLIELRLRDVSIDEDTIRDLTNSIYSVEVFSLKNCLGFDNLEIRDHDKLKKVVYHPHKDLKVTKFSIKAPNLE